MLFRSYNTDEPTACNDESIEETADPCSKKRIVNGMAVCFADFQTFHCRKKG